MCTTSAGCKTVITAVLMVMSGMDPHMISGNLRWVLVKSLVGFVEVGFFRLWVGHGETP
jgi:predicted ATP-dependent Lon-type protease